MEINNMISSETNWQIKELVKLQKQSRQRRKTSSFIVEGTKMIKEAVQYNSLKKIYISEFMLGKEEDLCRELLHKFPYEVVADSVFKHISDTVTTQGILGIASMPEYNIQCILNDKKHLWLLLDDLRDPGNLGTIMRTAEGAGASAVIMSRETVDLFNPKVVRSTMGAIFRQPFVYVDDLKDIIDRIKDAGFGVYGAAMQGSIVYDEADYIKGAGIVIGNEANGISEEILENVTGRIRIPMAGKLESLNAAVSAALIMYEAARQRRVAELV